MKKFYLIALLTCTNNIAFCEEKSTTSTDASSSVLQVLQQENQRLTKELASINNFRNLKNFSFFSVGYIAGIITSAIVATLLIQQLIIDEQIKFLNRF